MTEAQRSLLNLHGAVALRDFVKSGVLPDCPEVNARIALRCYWENPANWSKGPWFWAQYTGSNPYRHGTCRVQRVEGPMGVRWSALGHGWVQGYTTEEALTNLRSRGKGVKTRFLTPEESAQAEKDREWEISR